MEKKIIIAGIRICSKTKNLNFHSGDHCQLSELYTNTNLKGFFKQMKKLKIPYYVLSRKFGICTEGNHNTAYSSTEHITDEELLAPLKIQSRKYSNIQFIYYNHRPLTHNKWITMLQRAGYRLSCVQKLIEYEKFSSKKSKNLMSIINKTQRSEIYVKK